MSRSRSVMGAALLALSAPLILGSCVADSVSLRITCKMAPEDDCGYTEGGDCYLDGAINLASSRNRYYGVFLLNNGLKTRARDVPPRSEPNGVTIKEFEIEMMDSAGRKPPLPNNLPNPFTVSASGDIEPDSEGLVGAEILPRAYVEALIALNNTSRRIGSLRLSIIARGETWGRVDVESAPWPWTVQLVSVNERPEGGACVIYMDDVCTLGQDAWTFACNPAFVPEDI